jgi:hypothetical protein
VFDLTPASLLDGGCYKEFFKLPDAVMKTLKDYLVVFLCVIKISCWRYRAWIVGSIFMVHLMSVCSAFTLIIPPEKSDDEEASATQPVSNPAVGMGAVVVGGMVNSMTSSRETKGLQLKDPVIAGGLSYRFTEDTAAGGFSGDEFGSDIAFDADVYDGLILGALYQYTYRGAKNTRDTSEHLQSHGFSLYAAKRFLDLINAGVAYNHVASEHRLTRATNLNLDRDSNGFTALVGASDRLGKWSWATTPSFTYVWDDYDQQSNLKTGLFSWSNKIGYDLSKLFTVGAAFSYNHLVVQDTFGNAPVRDDNYWTIGPRLHYYATKNLTVNLDFDSQQGYRDYQAHTVRLSAEYSF